MNMLLAKQSPVIQKKSKKDAFVIKEDSNEDAVTMMNRPKLWLRKKGFSPLK